MPLVYRVVLMCEPRFDAVLAALRETFPRQFRKQQTSKRNNDINNHDTPNKANNISSSIPSLRYLDDQEDEVVLANEEDFAEALRLCTHEARVQNKTPPTLRIRFKQNNDERQANTMSGGGAAASASDGVEHRNESVTASAAAFSMGAQKEEEGEGGEKRKLTAEQRRLARLRRLQKNSERLQQQRTKLEQDIMGHVQHALPPSHSPDIRAEIRSVITGTKP